MTGSLKQRLRRLGGAGRPASGPTPQGDLAARLRRVAPARRRASGPRRPDDEQLAERLGAAVEAAGVLRLTRSRASDERHGRWRPADAVASVPMLLPEAEPDPSRWALIDTETSGLAGGTGIWVFCVGIGRLRADRLELKQWLLTRLDAEAAFLDAVEQALADADLLISYNGKCFDLPLLMTRFRLGRRRPVIEHLPHLDLLHPVRRAFARHWSDCRLARCEEQLLHAPRRDDLPGAEAPAAWLNWLHRADPSRLGAVLRHNRIDLVSLAALAPALVSVAQSPAAFGADAAAIARHELRRLRPCQAIAVLQAARPGLDAPAALMLANLLRRHGDWGQAIGIWETLAEQGDPNAERALERHRARRMGARNGRLFEV